MSAYNLVGPIFHEIFYTGTISVYLNISRIGRVITIWDEVFFKIKVFFDGLVIRNKVLSESSHRIKRHIDVVVEVLEVRSSVAFEFCLDGEFIECW